MIRARILTPWAQVADPVLGRTVNKPQLVQDYPNYFSWTDVTGQPADNIPPSPDLFTVEAIYDAATFATISADPNYSVLWSESI